MTEIKQIYPVLPWSKIDAENGSVGVDVELNDGRTFSFSVATPKNAITSMDRNHEPYFVSLPPPIIVKRLDEETLWSTFRNLFATETEEDSILRRYQVQMQ
jgi:hypothetical protein